MLSKKTILQESHHWSEEGGSQISDDGAAVATVDGTTSGSGLQAVHHQILLVGYPVLHPLLVRGLDFGLAGTALDILAAAALTERTPKSVAATAVTYYVVVVVDSEAAEDDWNVSLTCPEPVAAANASVYAVAAAPANASVHAPVVIAACEPALKYHRRRGPYRSHRPSECLD